jgi:carbon-monoxide dehydrogenase medium subunit
MQVPASFQYRKATSVEHALALLVEYGPESAVVAGGHSLLPMMKLRLAHPEALIDINDLTELAGIRVERGELVIGAMARHAELLSSAVAGKHFSILHDAERVIADPIVRNRGTVGGSLCQADPSEDLSAVFAALRAELVIHGPTGARTVAARDFFFGPYETVLGHGELLVEIRVRTRRPVSGPAASGLTSSAAARNERRAAQEGRRRVEAREPRSGAEPFHTVSAYVKVDRRAGDWAVGAAGAVLSMVGDRITEVGIGLTALGAPRFVAEEAEAYLLDGPPTEERFVEAGRIAALHCRPTTDQRGPADYKRHLAGELVTRALRAAVGRA